jgi:tetratricopeptide (TPR) repeat protein
LTSRRDASKKVGGWAFLFFSVLLVGYARPKAMAGLRTVRLTSDVFALPPASALSALSLGYRAALADLLYTSTIVSYGIHGEEHRRFEFVGQYLDSIVALDPHFCQTYRYADTFLIYQAAGSPGPDEVRHARRLLEQGVEMCPFDGFLWLSAGQFMAFIGTQFLADESEKEEFRAEGAKWLARAAELVPDNQNAQWQALAAAGIFTREGKREAAIAFLERVYNVTDSEELKASIQRKIAALSDEGRLERAKRRAEAFNEIWRRDMPFLSRAGLLVVGPPYDAAKCSGRDGGGGDCVTSWADWVASRPSP